MITCLVQRVHTAAVTHVETQQERRIKQGLLIYVCIGHGATTQDVHVMTTKLVKLKLFEDTRYWEKNINDIHGDIMLISNFTLLATFKKNKPQFMQSAAREEAHELFQLLEEGIKKAVLGKVVCGFFGEKMTVDASVDGPVNCIISTS